LQPQLIDSNHLLPFLNAYLSAAGVTIEDSALYGATAQFAQQMVQRRPITPLLARLFAEGLVTLGRTGSGLEQLPSTIPDLMLSYINNINDSVKRERQTGIFGNPIVQKAAKLVAWECLKHDYCPGQPALKDAIEIQSSLLDYLEYRLLLIHTVGPEENKVQFNLDPLSEYLALRCISPNSTLQMNPVGQRC
jgi:hypothetical protein